MCIHSVKQASDPDNKGHSPLKLYHGHPRLQSVHRREGLI